MIGLSSLYNDQVMVKTGLKSRMWGKAHSTGHGTCPRPMFMLELNSRVKCLPRGGSRGRSMEGYRHKVMLWTEPPRAGSHPRQLYVQTQLK